MPSPRPPLRPSRWWTDCRGRLRARIAAALRAPLPRTSAETDVRAGGYRKAERSSSPPESGGLLCLRRGDRFFRYVRPAPLGSLVQRELAAVRLTEGLLRAFLHCGRYLQPLRHGAERRATSPYTGETSPNGDIFSLRPQYRVALPSPRPVMPNSIRGGSSPLGPSCCVEAGGEAGASPIRETDFKTSAITPCKRKTPLPERTNRQGRFHRRNGVGKRNYHVAWGRNCAPVSGRSGSCAVTKIPACYLTVPII